MLPPLHNTGWLISTCISCAAVRVQHSTLMCLGQHRVMKLTQFHHCFCAFHELPNIVLPPGGCLPLGLHPYIFFNLLSMPCKSGWDPLLGSVYEHVHSCSPPSVGRCWIHLAIWRAGLASRHHPFSNTHSTYDHVTKYISALQRAPEMRDIPWLDTKNTHEHDIESPSTDAPGWRLLQWFSLAILYLDVCACHCLAPQRFKLLCSHSRCFLNIFVYTSTARIWCCPPTAMSIFFPFSLSASARSGSLHTAPTPALYSFAHLPSLTSLLFTKSGIAFT